MINPSFTGDGTIYILYINLSDKEKTNEKSIYLYTYRTYMSRKRTSIMDLAGAWSDISDEEAEKMKATIRERRKDGSRTAAMWK